MAFIVTPRQLVHRAELYHQLAQLTNAGDNLLQGLELLQRNPPNRAYRQPLGTLIEKLTQGATFSEALLCTGSWLPSFDIALLHAGETSGRLPNCFTLLADYYNQRAQLTRQVISDSLYPVALFHFAFMIVPVNRLTALVWQGDVWGFLLQKLWFFLPLWLVVIFVILACQGRHGEVWRSLVEKILRVIPVLGSARRALALARLAAALEALISAGVTIIEAWEIAVLACGSPALNRTVLKWKPRLLDGHTPAQLVSESSEFPEVFCNLYNTGEISGQLDESLLRLHQYYQDEGTRKLRGFAQWTPKIVYFIVMLAIAYTIISFWSNYFGGIADALNL